MRQQMINNISNGTCYKLVKEQAKYRCLQSWQRLKQQTTRYSTAKHQTKKIIQWKRQELVHFCHISAARKITKTLQKSGEFWVTVWNVWTLSIDQCRDNIAKSRQTEIDLRCFLQSITLTIHDNMLTIYN